MKNKKTSIIFLIITFIISTLSGFVFFQSILARSVLMGYKTIGGLLLFRNMVVSGYLPTYFPIVMFSSVLIWGISIIALLILIIKILLKTIRCN